MPRSTTDLISDFAKYLDETYNIKNKWDVCVYAKDLENVIKDYLLNNQIGMIDHKNP